MSDEYTIEQALGDYQGMDGNPLTYTKYQVMLAELAELRRCKWNWDEARRIANGTIPLRERRIEIAVLVAGDGDAEWERKAAEAKQ